MRGDAILAILLLISSQTCWMGAKSGESEGHCMTLMFCRRKSMTGVEECIFKTVGCCSTSNQKLSTNSNTQRITSIINASKIRQDGLHLEIEQNSTYFYHKSCVSTYTSKTHLKRLTKSCSEICVLEPSKKRSRRSDTTSDFNFFKHCLFCGSLCEIEKDSRNPRRWNRSILCRTADDGQRSFKNIILGTCDIRQDKWGDEVRLRVEGAISDLHAAEARYHDKCRTNFMAPKSVQLAISKLKGTESSSDEAFDYVIRSMNAHRKQIRNSSDLYNQYLESGGIKLSKRQLIEEISRCFADELIILRGKGIASILVFRETATDTLKVVLDETEDDDLTFSMKKISKQVRQETKDIPLSKEEYKKRIDCQIAGESCSPTFQEILTYILQGEEHALPVLMICNMITGLLKKQPTPLQTSLGVFIKGKDLIQELNKFGIVCTYDEVLRFKKSAALASHDVTSRGLRSESSRETPLVQVIVDNFDANISSQNGLQSTHALAMLLTQTLESDMDTSDNGTFRRIKKEEMAHQVDDEITVERYTGTKKPQMPKDCILKTVQPLKVLAMQAVSTSRATDRDVDFLSKVVQDPSCPEWNGYNSALNRREGHTVRSKTTSVYTPLIDMKPADPDTMLTAMKKADILTKQVGQNVVVFTCDQQLYRVAVHITWVYPQRFSHFFLRLGGMHFLMNFIGCVGTLMAGSGLSDILESSFGSVANMMSGKRYPQNLRALRILVEELLRNMIKEVSMPDDLFNILEDRARQARTTRLWLDMLIKPVLLMLQFVRAEKEADWPLHLLAVKLMMPYFFAAGHQNYARYGLYYLRTAEDLNPELLEKFLKGEHVTRHTPGTWNGIWTDMMIESTFMKYGKGPDGIIGITLKPNTLKTWALSLHTCSVLSNDIFDMTNKDRSTSQIHKEEMKGRISADAKDRKNIRQKLQESSDPLDVSQLPTDKLLQVVSGRLADSSVNADKGLAVGQEEMEKFERSWPDGFHRPLSKKIKTMAVLKNHVQIGTANLYDTNLIYSRIIGLQAAGREINIAKVLTFELAPVPTSMFTDEGVMRTATNKSTLKKNLEVELSESIPLDQKSIIIDGSAMLWVVHWPKDGKVKDFIDNVVSYIMRKMKEADVYLVFDRYFEYSIKGVTRSSRDKEANRQHKIHLSMPLPPQKILLTVTSNKVQLIDLVVDCLQEMRESLKVYTHKLVLTGRSMVPVEVNNGLLIHRQDLRTTHEEADVIIIQQVVSVAESLPNASITVLCDDTDVFVLLLHFYLCNQLTCQIYMESTSSVNKKCTDIKATAEKHSAIVPKLLAAHALTGCDTVAQCWGIGKSTAVKLLKGNYHLCHVGDLSASTEEIIQESVSFLSACYGHTAATMHELRFKVWKSKVGRRNTLSSVKIMSLPPTQEAFEQNVLRAHLQTCIWKHALDEDPPTLDPLKHGWMKDILNRTLLPVLLPQGTPSAPDYILKLLKCCCENCNSAKCGCAVARLPCTMFCECAGCDDCYNQHTRTALRVINESD